MSDAFVNPFAVGAVPKQAAPDPYDFSDRYNTELSPADEQQFQQWATATGRINDLPDYDMRGAWKSGAPQAGDGHFPDTWKKPSHPTFSSGSQYHGVDGHQGGVWTNLPNGTWEFEPSATNLQLHGVEGIQRYLGDDPQNKLVWPPRTQPR